MGHGEQKESRRETGLAAGRLSGGTTTRNVWKGKGETHLAVVLNFSVSRTLNPFFFSAAFLFRRDI